MSKRFLSVDCSHNKTMNQCAVYRKEEPKTFSSFVDKVVSELPVPILSKHPNNTRNTDPNNPLDVLKDKGLLNISHNSARTGDYPSQVDISFYTKESRLGETVKVFSSNHHFRNGKLVCSSSHELLPELPRYVEKFEEWWTLKGPKAITCDKPQLKVKSETVHHSSSRRKLTDILQDVERQNVIRRYESAANKRYRYCRSASPAIGTWETNEERRQRFLHTLRSQHTREKTTPFCMQKFPKSSPGRYKYRVTYKENSPLKIAPCQPVQLGSSSSETSVTSVVSHIYSSPGKTVQKNKRYSIKYRRTPPPKTKFKSDLFVIPQHTCRTRPYRDLHTSRKVASYWSTIQNFAESPEFKHCMHEHKPSERSHYDTAHTTPAVPFCKSEYQKFIERSTRNSSRKGEYHQKRDVNEQECNPPEVSPKCVLYLKSSSPTSSRIKAKCIIHGKTALSGEGGEEQYRRRKERHGVKENHAERHAERLQSRHSESYHMHLDKAPKTRDKLKHGIREVPVGQPFEHKAAMRKTSKVKSDSESSAETFPFLPSDSESEKGVRKKEGASSGSKTSVCSTFYSDAGAPHSEGYRKSVHCHKRELQKRHRKEHEEYSESSTETELGKHTKTPDDRIKANQEKSNNRKQVKTRRMINPNKIVHFQDNGRRLSQHYSAGKATMDSGKAFQQEEEVHCRKIKPSTRAPVSSMTCYAELHQKNGDYRKTKVTQESIVSPLDQKFLVSPPDLIIHNLVNEEALREYRVKYADSNKHITRKTEGKEHGEYNMAIKVKKEISRSVRSRHQEECEACKIENLLDINN